MKMVQHDVAITQNLLLSEMDYQEPSGQLLTQHVVSDLLCDLFEHMQTGPWATRQPRLIITSQVQALNSDSEDGLSMFTPDSTAISYCEIWNKHWKVQQMGQWVGVFRVFFDSDNMVGL